MAASRPPTETESASPPGGTRSCRRQRHELARELADARGAFGVRIPVPFQERRRRAAAEQRALALEPSADADGIVRAGEVADDEREEVEPCRDIVGRLTFARLIPFQAGERHVDQ